MILAASMQLPHSGMETAMDSIWRNAHGQSNKTLFMDTKLQFSYTFYVIKYSSLFPNYFKQKSLEQAIGGQPLSEL